MNTDIVVSAISASILTFALLSILFKRERTKSAAELTQHVAETRELEKKIHVREREFLNERNEAEIVKRDELREARRLGYEEGREFGQTERERDHLDEVTRIKTEFAQRIVSECELAAFAAQEKIRAEYERQSKLFSVKICPYLRITEDKSLFNKKHELVSGYQYQLLINGIPAFAPHVVPERTEIHSEINPELEKTLLGVARGAAEAAIGIYLGGNAQFAKMAPEKVERVIR